MATVRQKVTAGYHSCTGTEQWRSCGSPGLRCALAEIQDQRKHPEEDNGARSLHKRCFSSGPAGRMHRPGLPPGRRGPHPYHTSSPPHSSGAASDTCGRLCFWPSRSNPIVFFLSQSVLRYTISSDRCLVIGDGNIRIFLSVSPIYLGRGGAMQCSKLKDLLQ